MSKKYGSKIFADFTNNSEVENVVKKSNGRSKELLNSRNEKLCHRYYYYSRIICLQYSGLMSCLVSEFDISAFMVAKIISENHDILKAIAAKKLTTGQLKKLYPYYVWNDATPSTLATIKEMPNKEIYTGLDKAVSVKSF